MPPHRSAVWGQGTLTALASAIGSDEGQQEEAQALRLPGVNWESGWDQAWLELTD